MPDKRFRPRRPPRISKQDPRAGGVTFARRAVPQPAVPTSLHAATAGDGTERWELICRDGWEWQRATAPGSSNGSGGAPMVWVRAATLTTDQAAVVKHWIDRIRDPRVWWEVSRAMQTPESAPVVAQALQVHPWLNTILPVVLEASTEGAPPPPPK